MTISSVNVLGAVRTRKDFLARIFDPLLSANRDAPYTLAEALAEIYAGGNKLNKFGTKPFNEFGWAPTNTWG